jgi:hypothetical protein
VQLIDEIACRSSNLFSTITLAPQVQLDARRKKRQRRAREEKRRDKAITIEMNKQVTTNT